MTNAEELALVEAAIQKILENGAIQSYTISGRQANYVSLEKLQARRDILLTLVTRETYGAVSVAQNRRPD